VSQLAQILSEAAAGRFPPADGGVTVLPQESERDAGVIGFTAHAVIFLDADPDWIRGLLPPGNLSAPLSPAVLDQLGVATGRSSNGVDMLCTAPGLDGPPPAELTADEDFAHPRIQRALKYRAGVRAWRCDGGLMLLGQGLAGRWETAIEVDPDRRDRGLGTKLATAARHLVPEGEPLWAQVAPANAASVRVFLAAGFAPAGAEALLWR
jgi:GNAT superfamily N-acetyltransferase